MNITLRMFRDEDIDLFEKWLKKEYILKWYKDEQAWLHEVKLRDSEYNWVHHFIVQYSGKDIGFCQYYAIADDHSDNNEIYYKNTQIEGTYSIDYLIGDEEYLGKGLGKAMVVKLVEMVFSLGDAERIVVTPERGNILSCRTLESCGFRYDEANEDYILYRAIK